MAYDWLLQVCKRSLIVSSLALLDMRMFVNAALRTVFTFTHASDTCLTIVDVLHRSPNPDHLFHNLGVVARASTHPLLLSSTSPSHLSDFVLMGSMVSVNWRQIG